MDGPRVLTSLSALLVHDAVTALPALDRVLRLDQVVRPTVWCKNRGARRQHSRAFAARTQIGAGERSYLCILLPIGPNSSQIRDPQAPPLVWLALGTGTLIINTSDYRAYRVVVPDGHTEPY